MHRFLWLLIFSLQVLSVANAADYSLGYDIGTDYFYTDNINGSVDDPISANARFVSTDLTSARTTENHQTRLNVGLDFYDYNLDGYDTQNQRVQFSDRYQLEKNTFTLNAGLVRDSTNTSEQFREQANVETRFSADRREAADWNVGWENQLTETNRLNLSSSRSDINYANEDDVGYRSTGNTASISEIFSETTYFFLQYNRNDSDSDRYETFPGLASTQQSTKSNGLALGLNYSPDEYLLINGYLGKNTIETDPNGVDESGFCETIYSSLFPHCFVLSAQDVTEVDTTYADMSATWTFDVWDIKTGFSRNQQPDSKGELLDTDRWSTSASYRLNETNRLTASIVYRTSAGVVQLPGEDPGDREYWNYNVGWSSDLTEDWSVYSRINYYETQQPGRSGGDIATETWRYTVGVSYAPTDSHWSR